MWRSFHVYYHQDDNSGLLLDAVRPLVARLAPRVDRVYFVQHWLRGPHVRIHVDAGPEVFGAVVWPALDEIVGGYLVAHPSRAEIDETALAARHQRLAELEHEPGPLRPLHPDNSIHEAAYDRRTAVLGSEEAAELLADFYTATTGLAFDMLAHVRAGGQLVGLAFDLMVASAHGVSEVGLSRGFVSFRSHAEAFLSWWPEAEGLRQAWDRHYVAYADALTGRIRALAEAVDSGVGLSPLVRDWLAVMTDIHRRGAGLIAAGTLSMDPPWAGRRADNDEAVREMLSRSPFHNRERPAGTLVDQEWFSRYRLVLNYTYLQLTRIGLNPVERFLLCHLIANAAEQVFGVPATEVRLPVPGELAPVVGQPGRHA